MDDRTRNECAAEIDSLRFEYEGDGGTTRVEREWTNHGGFVREVTRETYYSYRTDEWEVSHEFTRDHDIDEYGRLVGDGSNWSGDGMFWDDYATERHETLLGLRFPHEFPEAGTQARP